MRRWAVLALVCAALGPAASAVSSGAVNVTLVADDIRLNPYQAVGFSDAKPAGARQTVGVEAQNGAMPPVRRAMVEVFVLGSSGQAVAFCGRTGQDGRVRIPWAVTFTADKLIVRSRPRSLSSSSCSSTEFEVRSGNPSAPNTIFWATETFETVEAETDLERTVRGETAVVYLTAEEVLDMHDAMGTPFGGGSSIRASVAGMQIFINQLAGLEDLSGGVAPTDGLILLPSDTGRARPFSVAHEIGHIVAWRNLGLPFAPINPVLDYSCYLWEGQNAAWSRFSHECSKAAFHDGFADVHAALWMWFRNADPDGAPDGLSHNPHIPTGSGFVDLETTGGCGDETQAFKKPGCHLRALWDLVDSAPTDGDGSTGADLSDLVGAFRAYPRLCGPIPLDNRCSWEGWPWPSIPLHGQNPEGNNWKDFKAAASASPNLTAAQLNSIEDGNGLTRVPD